MLKIEREKKVFATLTVTSLADAAILERYDLQEYIYNSPDAFFAEIGQKLFLIGKEVKPSDAVQDRIDLLALDEEGRAVVIELKRGNNKMHLLQAIGYAGMVAHWEANDFLRFLDDNKKEALEEFLVGEVEDINREQRMILIAEEFDYSVLVGAEWLSERFGVDIMCCRIALAEDVPTKSEYLVCRNVFPAPELAGQAKRRGGGTTPPVWRDWDAALADVANPAVVAHFREQIEKREFRLRKRTLFFRGADGKGKWCVSARKNHAYVWQCGRFEGDLKFWKEGLSQPNGVQSAWDERRLRFLLFSEKDFAFFLGAVTGDPQRMKWSEGVAADDDGLDENEGEG